jgi:hypothetical protein
MKLFKYLLLFTSLIALSSQCKFEKYSSNNILPFGEYRDYRQLRNFDQDVNTYFKMEGDDTKLEFQEEKSYSSCNNFCDKINPEKCFIECLSFKGQFVTHYYYNHDGENSCTTNEMEEYFDIMNKTCNIRVDNNQLIFKIPFNNKEISYNIESGVFTLGGLIINVLKMEKENNLFTLTLTEPVRVIPLNTNDSHMRYCYNALDTIYQVYEGTDCKNDKFNFYESLNDGNILYVSMTEGNVLGAINFDNYEYENFKLEDFNEKGFTKLILNLKSEQWKTKIYFFDFKRKSNCYKRLQLFLRCDTIKIGKKIYIYECLDNLEILLKDPYTNIELKKRFFLTKLDYLNDDITFNGLTKDGEGEVLKGKLLSLTTCKQHLEKITEETKEIIMITYGIDITLNKKHLNTPFKLKQYYPKEKEVTLKIAEIHKIENDYKYEIIDCNGRERIIITYVNMFSFLDCKSIKDEFYVTESNDKSWLAFKGKLIVKREKFSIEFFNFEYNKILSSFDGREILFEQIGEYTVFKGNGKEYRSPYNAKCFRKFQSSLDHISFCKNGFRYSGYEILQTSNLIDKTLTIILPFKILPGKIRNNIVLEFEGGKYSDFIIRKLNDLGQGVYSLELLKQETDETFIIIRIFFDFPNPSDCNGFDKFVNEQPYLGGNKSLNFYSIDNDDEKFGFIEYDNNRNANIEINGKAKTYKVCTINFKSDFDGAYNKVIINAIPESKSKKIKQAVQTMTYSIWMSSHLQTSKLYVSIINLTCDQGVIKFNNLFEDKYENTSGAGYLYMDSLGLVRVLFEKYYGILTFTKTFFQRDNADMSRYIMKGITDDLQEKTITFNTLAGDCFEKFIKFKVRSCGEGKFYYNSPLGKAILKFTDDAIRINKITSYKYTEIENLNYDEDINVVSLLLKSSIIKIPQTYNIVELNHICKTLLIREISMKKENWNI